MSEGVCIWDRTGLGVSLFACIGTDSGGYNKGRIVFLGHH